MRARDGRRRHGQRHDILQLITKSVGTARLKEGCPSPDTARQRLIQQPPIQQQVHGSIGCLHLDCAERLVPKIRHVFQDAVEIDRSVAFDQGDRVARTGRGSEQQQKVPCFVRA